MFAPAFEYSLYFFQSSFKAPDYLISEGILHLASSSGRSPGSWALSACTSWSRSGLLLVLPRPLHRRPFSHRAQARSPGDTAGRSPFLKKCLEEAGGSLHTLWAISLTRGCPFCLWAGSPRKTKALCLLLEVHAVYWLRQTPCCHNLLHVTEFIQVAESDHHLSHGSYIDSRQCFEWQKVN